MHLLTYSSLPCFSMVIHLFLSFFTSSFSSLSQGEFWLQRLWKILQPSSTNNAVTPSGSWMGLIVGNIVLLVKDLLSNFILKEKVSSAIFQHISNDLSVGRSSDKSWSFVLCRLCCYGIDCNNSLLLETTFIRLRPQDLHILIIYFTSCLDMFISPTDFKRPCT